MRIPSRKELDENRPKFPLLCHEDYELLITEVQQDVRERYLAKPNPETGKIPLEEIVNVTLEVQAFKDGSTACDEDGRDATGRKVWFTARPTAIGFKRDGTPSKTRCLIAYALGKNIEEEMELRDWSDLIGKTVYAEIGIKETPKGKRNVLLRFVAPPRKAKIDKSKIGKTDWDEIPVVEE